MCWCTIVRMKHMCQYTVYNNTSYSNKTNKYAVQENKELCSMRHREKFQIPMQQIIIKNFRSDVNSELALNFLHDTSMRIFCLPNVCIVHVEYPDFFRKFACMKDKNSCGKLKLFMLVLTVF